MITGINCWAEEGRVTAQLLLNYDLHSGAQDSEYCYLAVYFDGFGPFHNAGMFQSKKINVPMPALESFNGPDIDQWLRTYAWDVNEWLGEKPAPKPKAP